MIFVSCDVYNVIAYFILAEVRRIDSTNMQIYSY
jgi:hypothetical protein